MSQVTLLSDRQIPASLLFFGRFQVMHIFGPRLQALPHLYAVAKHCSIIGAMTHKLQPGQLSISSSAVSSSGGHKGSIS